MKISAVYILLLLFLLPVLNAQTENSKLRPLIRSKDSVLTQTDTSKSSVLMRQMKAAMEAQDKQVLKPFELKQKSWYEYLTVKTWVILGIAGVLLLGWIWRTFVK